MRTSTLVVFLLFFTVEFMVLPHPQVLAGPAEDVQSAMQLLKSKAAALGAPSLKHPLISEGREGFGYHP